VLLNEETGPFRIDPIKHVLSLSLTLVSLPWFPYLGFLTLVYADAISN